MFQSENSCHKKITFKDLWCLLLFLDCAFFLCWCGFWRVSLWAFCAHPWAVLNQEQEWSIELSILGSGIQTQAGPFVCKVLVDWSANESIRKLLAAEILSQRRVVHSLRETTRRPYACKSWLWP